MMLGPLLPLLLLAIPVAVSCGVLVAGIVGLVIGDPRPAVMPAPLPRAKARVAPKPIVDDDDVTLIFTRVLAR